MTVAGVEEPLHIVDLQSPDTQSDVQRVTVYNGRQYSYSNNLGNSFNCCCSLLALGSAAITGYFSTNALLSDEAKSSTQLMLACIFGDIAALSMLTIGVIGISKLLCCDRCCTDRDEEYDIV